MPSEKGQFPTFGIRAAIQPNTINKSERTVEVVFGTDALVRRRTWDGVVYEQLSFDPGHVRMDRLNSGAPLLDNHNRWGSVRNQLGSVDKAWADNGKGYAIVRFSKRDEVNGIWQDVESGIIRNVSVGYDVVTYEHTVNEEGPDTYRAVDWEPMEISMTQIPADYYTGVRSKDGGDAFPLREVNIIHLKNRAMSQEKKKVAPENGGDPTNEQGLETRNQGDNPTPPIPAPPAPEPTPTPARAADTPVNIDEAVQRALVAERTRTAGIIEIVEVAGLARSFADDLITRAVSMDYARKAVLDEWKKKGGPAIRNQGFPQLRGADEVEKTRSAIETALVHRAGGNVELDDHSRQYRGMSLMRMAEDAIQRAGGNTRSMTNVEIAQTALGLRSVGGMHSTSDFPIILGNTVNRSLRETYALAERTFAPFCRRATATDFREKTIARLSQLVKGFKEIAEGGEYKRDTLIEGKETYKIKKYGEIVAITWETIVNDDLNFVERVPAAIAYQAAMLQNEIVWGILTGNPTMGDGVALFHTASHGNLASSGGAISNTTLSAGRAAMRKQKDINGRNFLRVMPKFLLVGPDKETEAEQVINGLIVPTADSAVNVFKKKLEIIVEPLLTGNQWYIAAAPGTVDTIEYAFLEGDGELFTEQRQGFEVDGLEIKARMVFGAAAIDHVGLYKNPGA